MVRGTKLQSKKTCHLNFRLPLSWLMAPELLQLLELLNSFPIAFRPENGPFIEPGTRSGPSGLSGPSGAELSRPFSSTKSTPVHHVH